MWPSRLCGFYKGSLGTAELGGPSEKPWFWGDVHPLAPPATVHSVSAPNPASPWQEQSEQSPGSAGAWRSELVPASCIPEPRLTPFPSGELPVPTLPPASQSPLVWTDYKGHSIVADMPQGSKKEVGGGVLRTPKPQNWLWDRPISAMFLVLSTKWGTQVIVKGMDYSHQSCSSLSSLLRTSQNSENCLVKWTLSSSHFLDRDLGTQGSSLPCLGSYDSPTVSCINTEASSHRCCPYVGHLLVCICRGQNEGQRQLRGAGSRLPFLCHLCGLNSGHQSWQKSSSPWSLQCYLGQMLGF